MQIVENSSARLRLGENWERLSIFFMVIAVVFAIVVVVRHVDPRQLINSVLFALSAIFFRRTSQIDLDKSARRCEIWRRDMLKRSNRILAFDEIVDVRVELMSPDTSVQPHTRLSLTTNEGEVPLTAGFMASLDHHVELREAMVDVIFKGRARPAPLDPVQVLRDGGRPIAAAMRSWS